MLSLYYIGVIIYQLLQLVDNACFLIILYDKILFYIF